MASADPARLARAQRASLDEAVDAAVDEIMAAAAEGADEWRIATILADALTDAAAQAGRALAEWGIDPARVDPRQMQALARRVAAGGAEDRISALVESAAGGWQPGTSPAAAAASGTAAVRAVCWLRTEQIDIYRSATMAGYRAAPAGMLSGWQWLADLDDRTCPACIAMHGTVHPLSEDGPDDHPQGRCCAIPVLRGEEPFVAEDASEDWLASMTETEQVEALGPARWEAWRSGVPLQEMAAWRPASREWRRCIRPATLAEIGLG